MAFGKFDIEAIICDYFGNTLVAYNRVQIEAHDRRLAHSATSRHGHHRSNQID